MSDYAGFGATCGGCAEPRFSAVPSHAHDRAVHAGKEKDIAFIVYHRLEYGPFAKDQTAEGFETCDKFSAKGRKALASPVNTLAEDLSRMRLK